jgi:hypothetical protein
MFQWFSENRGGYKPIIIPVQVGRPILARSVRKTLP